MLKQSTVVEFLIRLNIAQIDTNFKSVKFVDGFASESLALQFTSYLQKTCTYVKPYTVIILYGNLICS